MKKRDSGIELLRIIAMIMIIGIHLFYYGDFYSTVTEAGGKVAAVATLIRIASRPCVNLFIIISGYFMSKSSFDLKKSCERTMDVYIKIMIYSVSLTVICLIIGGRACVYGGGKAPLWLMLAKMVFPLTSQTWYFLSNYILLCLLAPFINIVIQKITKKQYQFLLAVLTVVFSLWVSFDYIEPFSEWIRLFGYESMPNGKNIASFIYIYLIGGYIRFHGRERTKPNYVYIVGAGLVVITDFYLYTRGYIPSLFAINYSSPFVILYTVLLFLFFKDLHFKSSIVNTVASTTLGVYAIHEFYGIRNILWDCFDFSKIELNGIIPVYAKVFGVIILVFFVGAVIDLAVSKLYGFTKKKLVEIIKRRKDKRIAI